MKRKPLLIGMIVMTFFVAVQAVYSNTTILNNQFDLAFEAARIMNKGVIVVFSSRNCFYCSLLINETFQDPEVMMIHGREFVVVEIYADRTLRGRLDIETGRYDSDAPFYTYEELFGIFGIRGTPASVFFNRDLGYVGSIPGYIPAEHWVPVIKYLAQELYLHGIQFDAYNSAQDSFSGRTEVIPVSREDLILLQKAYANLAVIEEISRWKEEKSKWTPPDPIAFIGATIDQLPIAQNAAQRILLVSQ